MVKEMTTRGLGVLATPLNGAPINQNNRKVKQVEARLPNVTCVLFQCPGVSQ